MKFLGIDYGIKRIGIALSDEAGEFAFPKMILAAAGATEAIERLIKEAQVEGVVIGYSLATNMLENEITEAANAFKARLGAVTEVPIFFEREDFSTMEAHRYQTTKGNRDDSAAAIILQRFLDKRKK